MSATEAPRACFVQSKLTADPEEVFLFYVVVKAEQSHTKWVAKVCRCTSTGKERAAIGESPHLHLRFAWRRPQLFTRSFSPQLFMSVLLRAAKMVAKLLLETHRCGESRFVWQVEAVNEAQSFAFLSVKRL